MVQAQASPPYTAYGGQQGKVMDEHVEYCPNLKNYLMSKLDKDDRIEFESHLAKCESCAIEAASWKWNEEDLSDWVGSLDAPRVSELEAARLNRSAGKMGRKRSILQRVNTVMVALPLAAAVLVGLFFVLSRTKPPTEQTNVQHTHSTLSPRVILSKGGKVASGDGASSIDLAVPGQGRLVVALDNDRVALGSRSKAHVSKTVGGDLRIELERGTVAISAHGRRQGDQLDVWALGHLVRVIGTRFLVSLLSPSGVSVAVGEGEVEVVSAGAVKKNVSKGEILKIGSNNELILSEFISDEEQELEKLLQVTEEEQKPESVELDAGIAPQRNRNELTKETASHGEKARSREPNLAEVRKKVLRGEYSNAMSMLAARLKRSPRDAEALELLATCHRKTGDWRGAIRSFESVVEHGNAGRANRARFMAAALAQDKLKDHGLALGLLEDYLADRPRPLEAEAMVRLAKAQLALGNRAAAQTTIEKILEKFPGTPATLQARKLIPADAP